MDMPLATFSYSELETMLVKDGFEKGSKAFNNEFNRRYRATDNKSGRYMERYSWLAEKAA